MQTFAYDNIAISGGIGCGKSSLRKNLDEHLSPFGFKSRSTGDFFRKFSQEFIVPSANLWPDEMDIKVEAEIEKRRSEC